MEVSGVMFFALNFFAALPLFQERYKKLGRSLYDMNELFGVWGH